MGCTARQLMDRHGFTPTARCSHTLHTMVSFWLQKTALCEELLLGMNDHAQPAVCAAPARV